MKLLTIIFKRSGYQGSVKVSDSDLEHLSFVNTIQTSICYYSIDISAKKTIKKNLMFQTLVLEIKYLIGAPCLVKMPAEPWVILMTQNSRGSI